ncbi:hypothetical protein [Arthrobacter methylotrophus]|uniref:hypothetical protein n=1 Tax=Arthrobacter methylotrophus TaxID=121291 RepID=UPI0031E6C9BA
MTGLRPAALHDPQHHGEHNCGAEALQHRSGQPGHREEHDPDEHGRGRDAEREEIARDRD